MAQDHSVSVGKEGKSPNMFGARCGEDVVRKGIKSLKVEI